MYKVDNAVIMAAGTSSRFAPISYERHKALTEVRGEILIEREIRQLKERGISEIYVVTGYKSEQFEYLKDMYDVKIIRNTEYLQRNNNSSIYVAKDVIRNTYICSADNYFMDNPFEIMVQDSYYAAVYSEGHTDEWCMTEDEEGYIDSIQIGGENSWYMLGHVFWSENFSRRFIKLLEDTYDEPDTADKLWEQIFMEHLDTLKMQMRRYPEDYIYEFDTLDELRQFDTTYVDDSRSMIIKELSKELQCKEAEITDINSIKGKDYQAVGFTFRFRNKKYSYKYNDKVLTEEM